MIDLSIVVVTWNTRELTLDCLAALDRAAAASGLRTEVVVVDNGSRDGTAEALRRRTPRARLVPLPRNTGFAAGANAGLRLARGRYALLWNSDARPLAGALATCVRYLDEHPDVGVVGPRLLRPDGSEERSIHAPPRLWTELVPRALLQLWLRRRLPSKRRRAARPLRVEAVRGAALFVRGDVIREVGPLPERYFFFLEETDWCARIRRAGHAVVYHPGARVLHLSGASSKRVHPVATRIEYHRSLELFFEAHCTPLVAASARALRILRTGLTLVGHAPLALLSARARSRWRSHRGVLAWYLRGRPATAGLAAIAGEGELGA